MKLMPCAGKQHERVSGGDRRDGRIPYGSDKSPAHPASSSHAPPAPSTNNLIIDIISMQTAFVVKPRVALQARVPSKAHARRVMVASAPKPEQIDAAVKEAEEACSGGDQGEWYVWRRRAPVPVGTGGQFRSSFSRCSPRGIHAWGAFIMYFIWADANWSQRG